MFGIMVADYYLVKRQSIVLKDLYTMAPEGTLHFDGGWNRKALVALAVSGALSIGLSLAGAFGLMFNVGGLGLADRLVGGRDRVCAGEQDGGAGGGDAARA